MSTTHHTAIATGAAANAATVNSPLGELDAAIVAADLTSGGDIDGELGISETTIPTGAMLAVGGGIAVTNGAGTEYARLDDDGALILQSADAVLDVDGEITAFGSVMSVDTYASAASDNLVTINGGTVGQILILRGLSSSRTVTVKDGTGNIYCAGDFALTGGYNNYDTIMLLCSPGAKWVEISRSNNA